MCIRFFVSAQNFSRFRRVSPRCDGKQKPRGVHDNVFWSPKVCVMLCWRAVFKFALFLFHLCGCSQFGCFPRNCSCCTSRRRLRDSRTRAKQTLFSLPTSERRGCAGGDWCEMCGRAGLEKREGSPAQPLATCLKNKPQSGKSRLPVVHQKEIILWILLCRSSCQFRTYSLRQKLSTTKILPLYQNAKFESPELTHQACPLRSNRGSASWRCFSKIGCVPKDPWSKGCTNQ